MPSLVPTHTVILSRPHPSGRKDREGNPVHERITPKIGQPFDFTDEEIEHVKAANPYGLRDPVNEGEAETRDADAADKAAREAAEEAAKKRSAAGDAAVTARTGALGKGARKQPDNVHAGEAPGPEAEDADEL
jgi:hypothetical protein